MAPIEAWTLGTPSWWGVAGGALVFALAILFRPRGEPDASAERGAE